MKKAIIIILFLFMSVLAKADQLAWITLAQAKQAKAYLLEQKEIKLWCACCDNDTLKSIKITKMYYKNVSGSYYQVVVEGKDEKGNSVVEEIDLAYVHVKKDEKAYCLGKVLKFECDPCTEPLSW